jgi:hypothetical protein
MMLIVGADLGRALHALSTDKAGMVGLDLDVWTMVACADGRQRLQSH